MGSTLYSMSAHYEYGGLDLHGLDLHGGVILSLHWWVVYYPTAHATHSSGGHHEQGTQSRSRLVRGVGRRRPESARVDRHSHGLCLKTLLGNICCRP